jgi:flavodoxin
VCYSRSGRTLKVAQALAQALGADLEVVRDSPDGGRPRGTLRCVLEALLHRKPRIGPIAHRSADYALIVVGTPVWARNVAGPVRSYLAPRRGRFPRMAFFCTAAGFGQDKVLAELAALSGEIPVATLALTERSVDSGEFVAALAPFLARIAPGRA